MNILTEVITDESLDDIFETPGNYIDESYDLPLIKIWEDGEVLFTVFAGINDSGMAYIVLEDDELSEDFYPAADETLWDVYERAVDDWLSEG